MAVAKLVKNFMVLFLICAELLQVNGMRTNNEEEPDAPDAHIVYDQRQSGKYNIHVVIKDVAIIEMDQNEVVDDNYNDGEYYYDEDDLTVKPLNIKTTTSIKPFDSTTSIKPTMPVIQTTILTSENQNEKRSSTNPEEILTSTSPSDITTTTNFKELNNNDDFMAYLTSHLPAIDTKSRSKIEPIYAIEEPVLNPRHKLQDSYYGQSQSREGSFLRKEDSKLFKNSRIFKVKVHRSHQPAQITTQRRRCRSYQYRDGKGNCRGNRSSSGSILKRLFGMLVTLPFKQDDQQNKN